MRAGGAWLQWGLHLSESTIPLLVGLQGISYSSELPALPTRDLAHTPKEEKSPVTWSPCPFLLQDFSSPMVSWSPSTFQAGG